MVDFVFESVRGILFRGILSMTKSEVASCDGLTIFVSRRGFDICR